MKLGIVTPHFAPDVAPTGIVVTRIAYELAALGHELDVVTALPWYREHRIEPGYEGRMVRTEDTPWGTITRIHPFPSENKQAFFKRALAFGAFSALGAGAGMRGGRLDGVLAVSPPLTLGLTGWAIAKARRAPLVFNVQDVYPDVAIELGVLDQPSVIKVARSLEKVTYRLSDAVTVLSEDLKDNVAAKLGSDDRIHVIPNFVDTQQIQPLEKDNAYRKEFGLEGKTVVMYAGNVGLSQALDIVIDAANALAHDDDIVFVINGSGAKRRELERRASGLNNVRFVDMQPSERLPEVLAAADVHIVTLRRGLARSSVPSKSYSIMAAGRPLIASVDEGSEIARVATDSGAGLAVPPEDAEALTKAVMTIAGSPEEMNRMGEAGRAFVQRWVSPAAVAQSYEDLFANLTR